MPHLVVAPDKFRGTASATEVCAAVAGEARSAGWTADQIPMSDGGEGLLEALGGDPRTALVSGPTGAPVEAEWRLLESVDEQPPTAVIEMSRAAGRALLRRPQGDEPLTATTAGVGQLLLAARDAGAKKIVLGCGGSATTDGGLGAVEAMGSPAALDGVELIVACDVTTAFRDAAVLFGPQKGASRAQVALLQARLDALAERYQADFGIDVDALPGAGAAGGLAGGLAALGARIVPGFTLVADLNRLPSRLARADLVVTGEGHLDPPSFSGKVPGGVLELVGNRCPVLCLVGDADRALLDAPPSGLEIISLTRRFGRDRARRETLALLAEVTRLALPRFCP